ncbi:hypothetical protein [Myxococcus qinghaiensis]|uniref:hypothetical protein n=1 Tax=Myxococcus qinghaiensis TaxID=2906758 RepID=UPI0020A72008|nr:hypothetical protein [Myxococcus qinghaiensis]MCP3162792.1 hypothetical protein [Myxococcus qinghaiensis]
MKRWVASALVLAVGCTPLDMERRTERGPVLRTYLQESQLGERMPFARTEVSWPQLTLRFSTADICRTEQHAEYAEDIITTRSVPGAAGAVSSGGVLTAVGGFLVLGRTLFSNSPDRDGIDREGHYGASSRKVATTWGVVLLSVGVPALVAGIVQLTRSGETKETRKADEMLALREVPCQPQPADGVVDLAGGNGPPPEPRATVNGTLVLSADEARSLSFKGLLLDGSPVLLQDEDLSRLETFRTCASLLAAPVDPEALARQAKTHPDRLRTKRELVRACTTLPGAPAGPLLEAIDSALALGTGIPQEAKPSPPATTPSGTEL